MRPPFAARRLLFAALLPIVCSTVTAQDSPPQPEPQTPSAPQEAAPAALAEGDVADDTKIDQFADAYLAIEAIHTKVAAQLKDSTTTDESDAIKANAETEIIAAVERSGLRLDEFNRIADVMASNTELRAKVASRVAERRKR
jgi:hypothetical protein